MKEKTKKSNHIYKCLPFYTLGLAQIKTQSTADAGIMGKEAQSIIGEVRTLKSSLSFYAVSVVKAVAYYDDYLESLNSKSDSEKINSKTLLLYDFCRGKRNEYMAKKYLMVHLIQDLS